MSRYLINDAAVLFHKPLVSGAALKFDGQCTVYNYGEDCPCYRCLFPVPPTSAASCSDSGVLGMVPGFIGCLQSLETIKVLCGFGEVLAKRLVVFDGLYADIRTVKLRSRRVDCAVCGESPKIKSLKDVKYWEYMPSCGVSYPPLPPFAQISPPDFSALRSKDKIRLVDVRNKTQFDICHLEDAEHIPLSDLTKKNADIHQILNHPKESEKPIYVMCRRGILSLEATHLLRGEGINAINVDGGLQAWHHTVDPRFPLY